jgi:hypothetical protein
LEELVVALKDPLAVYNAANNVEALLLCNVLAEAGIEAFVTEDVSQIGTWVGGLVPEIHKPQVWIERADTERAVLILEEFERRTAARNADESVGLEPIPVLCEECGTRSTFPATKQGTVQNCPHCGAYLDIVEGSLSEEDYGTPEEETD